MKYYLDTEFNEFGGELISLALVREDGHSLYLVYPEPKDGYGEWVKENVVPILSDLPSRIDRHYLTELQPQIAGARSIAKFFGDDPHPHIITDWPDDVRYFCQAIITGPGMMAAIDRLTFDIVRVDAYPTKLEGAVQHNAWWDAMALRELLQN